MYNFLITCDNGSKCIIRAKHRKTAIMLFCKAEGCSEEWFHHHGKTKKMSEV